MARYLFCAAAGLATSYVVYNNIVPLKSNNNTHPRTTQSQSHHQQDLYRQLKQRRLELDKIDKDLHLSDLKNDIVSIFPLEAEAINSFTDEKVVTDLMFICVMYDKPLKPHRRIQVRETVARILKTNELTDCQVAFLQKFMEHYEV